MLQGDRTEVQRLLDGYRTQLYGGRGPGITEEEWLARTSLRSSVAGVPTAASREALHLRTLRARGDPRLADAEARWAGGQFGQADSVDGDAPVLRRGNTALDLLLIVAGWLARRRRNGAVPRSGR